LNIMTQQRIRLLLFFILSCFIACQKDTISDAEAIRETPIEQIVTLYQNLGLDSKFNPDQEAVINWIPKWEEGIVQKANDTVEYMFVPLRPYLKKNKDRIAVEKGGKTYLLVKNGKEFYKAFYYTDNSEEMIEIRGFSGKMLLKNLTTGKANLIEYINGSPHFKDSLKSLKSSSQPQKWAGNSNVITV